MWIMTPEGVLECISGGASCAVTPLLEAEPSDFHDQALIDATQQINQILAAIPPDPQGRTVSFLYTKFGTILAWVRHGSDAAGPDSITGEDDDETVIEALGLRV
jgi:hypothetical protein